MLQLACPPAATAPCAGRHRWYDKYTAYNVAVGVTEYEAAIPPVKQSLFKHMFAALQQLAAGAPVNVLEVGLGSGAHQLWCSEGCSA